MMPSSSALSVLGLPWLLEHNPHTDRSAGRIVSWSPFCHAACLQSALTSVKIGSHSSAPEPPDLTSISSANHDIEEVFSKQWTLFLPPHRPYDCAIEILLVAPWPLVEYITCPAFTGSQHLLQTGPTECLTSRQDQKRRRVEDSFQHPPRPLHWRLVMGIRYAHNSVRSAATGMTPFECSLGFFPPLFLAQEGEVAVLSVQAHLCCCHRLFTAIVAMLIVVIHWSPIINQVWLCVKDTPLKTDSRKLSPCYIGLYEIVRIINPSVVKIKLPQSMTIQFWENMTSRVVLDQIKVDIIRPQKTK